MRASRHGHPSTRHPDRASRPGAVLMAFSFASMVPDSVTSSDGVHSRLAGQQPGCNTATGAERHRTLRRSPPSEDTKWLLEGGWTREWAQSADLRHDIEGSK